MNPNNLTRADVIAADAPTPDEVDTSEPAPVDTLLGLSAVDYDGARYCLECAADEYIDLCREDPYQIPYGGPVPTDHEVDCPGMSCDVCARPIGRQTLLHYDGVCGPHCPEN